MDRLMRECELDWVKIDYNIDIGDDFDGEAGDALYRHIRAYYAWLDELRAAYPGLVVENCSSGGLRFDLGIIAHTHTTWLSDVVEPKPSLQLGYGCTVEFTPEVCNHWMVGDKDDGTVHREGPVGWWDFLFRVPMNGQYGISSKAFDWGPELKWRAAENVALYKSIREILVGADVYHLTPQPDRDDPRGWMALQYVAPDRSRSVVTAYRLGGGEPSRLFPLRGLDPAKRYAVNLDGKPAVELQKHELTVTLDAEWRAAVIKLEATK
jgi:alpha-galactosidase